MPAPTIDSLETPAFRTRLNAIFADLSVPRSGLRRQTVLSGIRAAATPAIPLALGASSSTQVTLFASAVDPLIVSFAAGFNEYGSVDYIETLTSNLVLTLPTNATNYVYLERNPTTGALSLGYTQLKPIYLPKNLYAGAGQHYYAIDEGIMYLGNGTTAVPVQRVFVGQASPSFLSAGNTFTYAYNGRCDLGKVAALPAVGVTAFFVHALGCMPATIELYAQCVTTEFGYGVGVRLRNFTTTVTTGAAVRALSFQYDERTATLRCGAGGFMALRADTADTCTLTAGSWQYGFVVDRGW